MRLRALALAAAAALAAGPAAADTCPNGRSANTAMWYSILHPGLGEWYLNGWGPFTEAAPDRKFIFGFIPLYGWPGYLQVKSARDAHNCKTTDGLRWND